MQAEETSELDAFIASAQRVVDYLAAHTALTDWSVSRVAGQEQVHLHVRGDALLHAGDRVPWEQTFCRRMLAGADGLVHDATLDADYADLPAAGPIRAYAGVPILDGDGSLFGTLCGVAAQPLVASEPVDRTLLDLFGELLSSQLLLVRDVAALQGSARLAETLANSDRLTGVLNRRGWDLFVAAAQERIDALGDRAAILVIDLDGLKAVNDGQGHHAGDALLASAAAALQQAAGERDIVARYGGDEFAVYVDGLDGLDGGDGVDDSDPAALAAVARAYARALAVAGVSASIGVAPVLAGDGPGTAVQRAFAEADAAMYADKVRRRADAVPPGGPR